LSVTFGFSAPWVSFSTTSSWSSSDESADACLQSSSRAPCSVRCPCKMVANTSSIAGSKVHIFSLKPSQSASLRLQLGHFAPLFLQLGHCAPLFLQLGQYARILHHMSQPSSQKDAT